MSIIQLHQKTSSTSQQYVARLKSIKFSLIVFAIVATVFAFIPGVSKAADAGASPVFVREIFSGYRDWKFISVAHEEGELNDIRVILGNDIAIKAYRENKLPFPEGAIIARIAWKHVPSEENNKIFGRAQSFVPGEAPVWYLQFMVKDSKKYSATGGWGYGQFDKDGNPANEAPLKNCFPCHQKIAARDFVFTGYAP